MTAVPDGCFSIADAIQITKGRLFVPLDPFNPRNDFDIDYVAHSLALQCRWMGGTSVDGLGVDPLFYSVAQHSCIVSDLAQAARRTLGTEGDMPGFYGLMHDASEAYLCDIPRPLKPYLVGYYEYEAKLMEAICRYHEVDRTPGTVKAVKIIDNYMIYWERDQMIGVPEEVYSDEATHHPGNTIFDVVPTFEAWSPKRAKKEFLWRFENLANDPTWINPNYYPYAPGHMRVAA